MVLTQKRLKELYLYEPTYGTFTRKRNSKVALNLHNGYIRIFVDNKEYYGHRLAFLYMNGSMPIGTIDHVNHNKIDNRWVNLREVTHQENCKNFTQYKNNSSGVTGIYWHSRDSVWNAFIYDNGKKIHLGCFKDKKDAISARQHANIEHGFHMNHGQKVA